MKKILLAVFIIFLSFAGYTQSTKTVEVNLGYESELYQGDYGIDFASKNLLFGKNSAFDNNGLFFLGKTTIDYQIYTGTKTSIVDFTAFERDGFWDLPLTKGDADGIGPGKEWKNSRPYAFLPRSWSISFPNPENINWKQK